MLPLLFANDDIVAVNKPEGMATIPERRPTGDSLLDRLTAQLGERLYVVHRLDKDASGIVLMARHAQAHRCLNDQFATREVEKAYLALVHGRPPLADGTIDLPLRPYGSGRMGVDRRRGKPSVTHYRVLDRGDHVSLLDVHPRTGRRHQIRVHLYAAGHPLVGDRRYGDIAAQRAFARLMLHARQVACRLPSGAPIRISAPPPPSFQRLIQDLLPTKGDCRGPCTERHPDPQRPAPR